MGSLRDIQDYKTLVLVRRRRIPIFHAQLEDAVNKHKFAIQLRNGGVSKLSACAQAVDRYSNKVLSRTNAGARVDLSALQAARDHMATLKELQVEAENELVQLNAAIDSASSQCKAIRKKIANNDCRIDNLEKQILGWKIALAETVETAQDDEVTDSAAISRRPL